jgi:hypothetical protein
LSIGIPANETFDEINDDQTFDYLAYTHENKNLSDYSIWAIVKAMQKRYAKKAVKKNV